METTFSGNTNQELNNEQINESQMDQQRKPMGVLFGSIEYMTKQDIDNFIDNLTPEQAQYCLLQALNYAHSKGVYGILEAELLSKSLRISN